MNIYVIVKGGMPEAAYCKEKDARQALANRGENVRMVVVPIYGLNEIMDRSSHDFTDNISFRRF